MQTTEINTGIKWSIDAANSQIGFKVKYLMFSSVPGRFNEFDASIYTTGEDFKSLEIDCWINPASVDTGNEQRDAHLKAEDFFDVEKFKEINFTLNTLEETDKENYYLMYGELTIKGIKKQIKLDVEFGGIITDPWATRKALFKINGKINRKDWGLNWNSVIEAGGVLVSDEVWINCEILLTRQV